MKLLLKSKKILSIKEIVIPLSSDKEEGKVPPPGQTSPKDLEKNKYLKIMKLNKNILKWSPSNLINNQIALHQHQ